MIVQVQGQTELRLSRFDLDDFEIVLENKMQKLSALAMFVTSLGRCTFAVLDHYALRMDVEIENIVTKLTWSFSTEPTRFKVIDMDIYWPELPEKRLKSVERAAHKCTIHTTIHDCVEINIRVFNQVEGSE
ncbi:MAG TPA: OsmC family peroxiredoxin [Leucothrix mucor]|nr:OsmC family peroxiredoxin [Leucothrix mucor]